MSADFIASVALLGQGMLGIFTVLGIIALVVRLLSSLDSKK